MPSKPAIPWGDVAAVACAAHDAGRSMTDAICAEFNVTIPQARGLLHAARHRHGHNIPLAWAPNTAAKTAADLDDTTAGPDEPGDWATRAACRGLDPDLFFPERGEPTREARTVCNQCPVRVDCLNYALDNNERFGMWGGLSERQRRRIRAGRTNHLRSVS